MGVLKSGRKDGEDSWVGSATGTPSQGECRAGRSKKHEAQVISTEAAIGAPLSRGK